MRIYVYNEHCTRAGQVARESEEDLGDLFLYGEGTKEELAEAAKKSLATRYDTRPGGAGDYFRWKCDRNVLAFLS